MAGVYIHVPFCRQACHYCDFHFSTQTNTSERMVEAIAREAHLREAELHHWKGHDIQSLYLGGGTPSLLSEEAITRLIQGVSKALHFDPASLQEVTLEANPEDLTRSKLDAWKRAGVQRLSVGIQSFHDDTLAWMNRAHTGAQAEEGVRRASEAGFSAITVDLIYGVPTARDWKDDVARALALPVQHLSAYALTVEPQTVLGSRAAKGQEQEAPDERTVAEYRLLCDTMNHRGWTHYETSNWAAPKAGNEDAWRAIHNSAYWSGAPYLGLGPGAHGFLPPVRYANISNNPRYLKSIALDRLNQTTEALTESDRYNESIMTGLRTDRGICQDELEQTFGLRPELVDAEAWSQAVRSGDLIQTSKGRHRVPESRWITGDRIASTLFHVPAT